MGTKSYIVENTVHCSRHNFRSATALFLTLLATSYLPACSVVPKESSSLHTPKLKASTGDDVLLSFNEGKIRIEDDCVYFYGPSSTTNEISKHVIVWPSDVEVKLSQNSLLVSQGQQVSKLNLAQTVRLSGGYGNYTFSSTAPHIQETKLNNCSGEHQIVTHAWKSITN